MGRIVISNERDTDWSWADPKSWKGAVSEGEPSVKYKRLTNANSGAPNSQLCEYEPGHNEAAHSHPHDEVLYILDGRGNLADQELEPGIFIFIERDTEYGPLSAGSLGLRFLRIQMSD